jgi:hypothetical protein
MNPNGLTTVKDSATVFRRELSMLNIQRFYDFVENVAKAQIASCKQLTSIRVDRVNSEFDISISCFRYKVVR